MPPHRSVAVWCAFVTAALITLSPAASGRLVAARAQRDSLTSSAAAASKAALDKYCVSCHNQKLKTAGLALDALDVANPSTDGPTWEKVIRKLRAGAMPPVGLPRPDPATYEAVASYAESELDRAAAAKPNPGYVGAFHRLTRTEYANAIRDLLALDVLPRELDIATLLPADNSSSGFDTLADLLFVSPTALDAYLSAARKISRLAVGDPTIPVIVDRHLIPPDLPQDVRQEGAPVGTRGGVVIRTALPADGEYRLTIEFAGNAREKHELEISVDGARAEVITVGTNVPTERGSGVFIPPPDKPVEVRVAIKAGPRTIAVAYVEHTGAIGEELVRPRKRGRGGQPALARVTVSGPYNVTGSGDTPSRRRLFVCHPTARSNESECARQILSTLTRRAYRRASKAEDVEPLLAFYETGRSDGGFEHGIQAALARVLVSPQFLFRIEREPAPGTVARINDVELASRLSFFLWSSIPDDELLDVAIRGKLKDPGILNQQVRRMIADRRAQALVTNFAEQWLYLRDVEAKRPDDRVFPDFDESLRVALKRETELFIESIIREDHGALDLLTADYTFVNERLAKHYGIPHVYGPEFRRVTLTQDYRRGLLGQGSVLLLTSYSTRTSPVLRGKYVLGNLLGTPPPPPPADVPALKTEKSGSGTPLSMREAMTQHRANPVCATCHARMDPIGFALDNFDAVGRWRTVSEAGTRIDAAGALPDGTRFEGVVGLRNVLVSRPQLFIQTLLENLLTYGLGRTLGPFDGPVVRGIARDAAKDDYRFSSLLLGIIKSTPFQMRTSGPPPETSPVRVTASQP
jgi:mono/diheme cytochrome c family protein